MPSGTREPTTADLVSRLVVDVQVILDREGLSGPGFDEDEARRVLTRARALLDRRPREDADWALVLQQVSQLCILGQQPWLLDSLDIPRPTYNIYDSNEANMGPWWELTDPPALPDSPRARVFGKEIGCPFGLASSALSSHPAWVHFYSQRGYNVITYRTVRAKEMPVFPEPNWLFAEGMDTPLPAVPDQITHVAASLSSYPRNPHAFSMVNSFGVPSRSPQSWRAELIAARRVLQKHQMLIASVMGTPETCNSSHELAESFASVALDVQACGIEVIELNLSSPNIADGERVAKSVLYESVDDCEAIVSHVRASLDPRTKLMVKLGYQSRDALRPLLAAIGPKLDGLAGINALPVAVDAFNRESAVGSGLDRPRAGLSGIALRDMALDFTVSVKNLRDELGLTFAIFAMGGVMTANDAISLWRAGADVVQSATAALVDWRLSVEVLNRYVAEIHSTGLLGSSGVEVDQVGMRDEMREADEMARVDLAVLQLVRRAGRVSVLDLRGLTSFPTPEIRASLSRLASAGGLSLSGDIASVPPKRRWFHRMAA